MLVEVKNIFYRHRRRSEAQAHRGRGAVFAHFDKVVHSFNHRLRGYLCATLTKKAAVVVALVDNKKCIQGLDFQVGFMPNMTVNRA